MSLSGGAAAALFTRAALLLALLALPAAARAASPPSHDGVGELVLYTVGPGQQTFERFGHSLLCVESGGPATCYDFGRWAEAETACMVRASLGGRPAFGVVRVPLEESLGAFAVADRVVERQRLPLDPRARVWLGAELERRVQQHAVYAYHPLGPNCATELRDLLDQASGGALRRAARAPGPASPTYRALARDGLRGKVLELALLTLLVGPSADRAPSPWERAFLPRELARLVEQGLGAPREPVVRPRLAPLPSSPYAGELALGLLSALLALGLLRARDGATARAARLAAALLPAGLGLGRVVLSLFCVYPELALGAEFLVLPPTDLLLLFGGDARRRRYLRVRVTLGAGATLLGLLGVPGMPPLSLALLSLTPALAYLVALRRGARAGGVRGP